MATLDFDYDYDFYLVGIFCHYKDYRLAWTLNTYLNWDLKKEADYTILNADTEQAFSCYMYVIEDEEIIYYLLENRGSNGFLVPERKDVHYFLLVEGLMEKKRKEVIIHQIKGLKGVLSAIEIDPKSLRSKQNLLME
ncbi:MAG: IPExxxVDY family protein [Flavobacteriales bacterium]|nr:IPExxxVDY family protein [Flavobacteriales bacterium]